jgi:para-nitrobenzyl esterase
MKRLRLLAAAALAAGLLPAAAAADLRVAIEGGTVEGVTENGVTAFKGIPYAAPPVGPLRWRGPQPVAPWPGVRAAGAYGNDCVQFPIPGDAGAGGSTRGEDCLVLNVWRPAALAAGARLPVLVWIHGGGFVNGAASVPFFDGSAFARRGVVLVGFNYRLGRMGFFAHPALTAAGERPLANYGLADQLAALRWVQRNVAAFGGDPDAVTVAGESAGGISVIHLLSAAGARGLFQRAAVLSGGGRTYLLGHRRLSEATGPLPSAEAAGLAFAESAGIRGSDAAALAALRALPAEQVNGDLGMLSLVQPTPTYAGGPIFDGEVVTAMPAAHFRTGHFAPLPLLIGTTSDDLGVQGPPDPSRPLDFFGPDAARARELYDPQGARPPEQIAKAISADVTMHEPARFVARHVHAAGAPVWLYRFDYVADHLRDGASGAAHASELGYLFDQLDARYGAAVSERDRQAASLFHAAFVAFARQGDPNGEGAPAWTRFDPARPDLMHFGPDGTARMEPDPLAGRLELVSRALDREGAYAPGP